jgi:hypothetical protein
VAGRSADAPADAGRALAPLGVAAASGAGHRRYPVVAVVRVAPWPWPGVASVPEPVVGAALRCWPGGVLGRAEVVGAVVD